MNKRNTQYIKGWKPFFDWPRLAVTATMNISGGQINPAITLCLMSIGKEKASHGIANIVSQLIGGAIGSAGRWAP